MPKYTQAAVLPIGTEVMVAYDPVNKDFQDRSGQIVETMWSTVLNSIVYVVEMHNTPPGFTEPYRMYQANDLEVNE